MDDVKFRNPLGREKSSNRLANIRDSIFANGIASFLAIFFASASVHAATKLDFWHSYGHQPTHFAFHLASYKRGLFFGPCGPSTMSLNWSFDFDLAGDGPTYDHGHLKLTNDEAAEIKVVSGEITIDSKRENAEISLFVNKDGSTTAFIGNGKYRIKKLK